MQPKCVNGVSRHLRLQLTQPILWMWIIICNAFVAVRFILRTIKEHRRDGDFTKVETSAWIRGPVNNLLGYFSQRLTPSSILMILHIAILSKSFATYFARKWLFLHMNDFMTFQSAFGFKSFTARRFRVPLVLKVLPQVPHVCKYFGWTWEMCVERFLWELKALSHLSHLNCFGCTLRLCCWRYFEVLKTLSHLSHICKYFGCTLYLWLARRM